ncbi:bacterio-opsin activator domain-containing protein [Natrononativus amylolyticus]|uniref:bacterio-opsin activator domain-containing protein n=1 Tax=Natrononativus amylolyticus TaxID=2963434 RepID=UPI0020CC06CA|nr:bacterio-opsin activator domain-containing protein [Natrononativus amylolyticus]
MSPAQAVVTSDVPRVLVVGDSDRTAAASSALESTFTGPSLLRARTAEEAIERLSDREVHCVVCDVDAGGRATLETIREYDRSVPIVALAAERSASDALAAGATDVLGPRDPTELVVGRVRNAAERYRLETRTGGDRYHRSALEHSNALVLVLTAEGAISYASPAFEREMGYTPDELERTRLRRLVHPDDHDAVDDAVGAVAGGTTGTTRSAVLRLGHADGTWHVSEVTCTNRLADPTLEGLVLTVTDAGRRPEPDARLEEAAGGIEHAFFTLGDRWELTYANEAATALFDGRVDLEGTVVWDLLPESVTGPFYERFLEARTTGSLVEFETEFRPLEAWFEVYVHPTETGVSVYARDVTLRKTVAGDRRDRVAHLESVLDAVESGVFVLELSGDPPSADRATISLANAAMFELLEADAIVGHSPASLLPSGIVDALDDRLQSPVVRRMDPIEGSLETPDGPRSVSVSVSLLPDDEHAVCVIRDDTDSRASTEAVTAIHRTTRTLLDAETRPDVCQTVVDVAVDLVDAELAGCYLADGDVLRPVAFSTRESTPPFDLPTLAREETVLGRTLEEGEPAVYDRETLGSFVSQVGVRTDRMVAVPIAGSGVLFATASDLEAFDTRERDTLESLAATAEVTLERLERESHVRDRELELSRTQSRLERLEAIDERRRQISKLLVSADSREEIERGTCRELAELEWVELAMIGETSVAMDEITPRTWAGHNDGYLNTVSLPVGADSGDPSGRTASTREPTVVDNVVREPRGLEWRRAALDREFQSVLSVPLVYDQYVYGVLTLYADRPAAFDDDTLSMFEALGETIAYAISAIETKRALLTDTVIELELLLRGADDPLASIARRASCRLDVETVVPRSAEETTVFVTASETSADALEAAATESPSVMAVRLIADREEGNLFELTVSGSTIATTLADHGGVLCSIDAEGGQTRVIVELPGGADVRSFVSMLERKHPGTELVARRERERSGRPPQAFSTELYESLTDRQLRSLETAYYSGFFEWPRESTGEEVAQSLGVSQPTFNRHFRAAERKLFTLLFDELEDPP